MHEFENFNYKFSITTTDTAPAELRSSFIEEMNQIDNIMINHYLSLEFIKKIYFVLTQEDVNIGYGCGVIENGFLTIYELFVLPEYRELGFGTKIFNEIRTFTDTSNLKIRSITLPSDRTGKNFYESNLITARALVMEEKRENSRYRP
ncbi:GNAT family N-acetyltransferase [Acidimicrobiia bacterium]|nr:GNAT family N-acetyltransferase [Candidatus Actinomarina sp.]MDB4823355.1 GNAT family N-acetyltransferase [Acidimicrobiia bacterium]